DPNDNQQIHSCLRNFQLENISKLEIVNGSGQCIRSNVGEEKSDINIIRMFNFSSNSVRILCSMCHCENVAAAV
ncbi:10449_t:CDS:2, partial [Racocetra persica]